MDRTAEEARAPGRPDRTRSFPMLLDGREAWRCVSCQDAEDGWVSSNNSGNPGSNGGRAVRITRFFLGVNPGVWLCRFASLIPNR